MSIGPGFAAGERVEVRRSRHRILSPLTNYTSSCYFPFSAAFFFFIVS